VNISLNRLEKNSFHQGEVGSSELRSGVFEGAVDISSPHERAALTSPVASENEDNSLRSGALRNFKGKPLAQELRRYRGGPHRQGLKRKA
jgi:hypothetical protein